MKKRRKRRRHCYYSYYCWCRADFACAPLTTAMAVPRAFHRLVRKSHTSMQQTPWRSPQRIAMMKITRREAHTLLRPEKVVEMRIVVAGTRLLLLALQHARADKRPSHTDRRYCCCRRCY